MLKKATGFTDDDWPELFNQKLEDWRRAQGCSESKQAVVPPTIPTTTMNTAAPAASKAPATPAAPAASAIPTNLNQATMWQGGPPSSSEATMAYLDKIDASPASARVLARAEDVSLAPVTASETKVENHPDFAGISGSLDDSGHPCGLSRPCSSNRFLFEQKECTTYGAFALSTSSTPCTADGDRITCQIAAPVPSEEEQDHQLPPSIRLDNDEDYDEESDDENYVTTTATTTRIPTTSTATSKPIIAPVIPIFIL